MSLCFMLLKPTSKRDRFFVALYYFAPFSSFPFVGLIIFLSVKYNDKQHTCSTQYVLQYLIALIFRKFPKKAQVTAWSSRYYDLYTKHPAYNNNFVIINNYLTLSSTISTWRTSTFRVVIHSYSEYYLAHFRYFLSHYSYRINNPYRKYT